MITRFEILKDREKEYPLNEELEKNLKELLRRVNIFREIYGQPMTVNSGYRPGHYNVEAKGAPQSAHLTCEAVDIKDADGKIKKFITENPACLLRADLYCESFLMTPTWVHFQTRKTPSGNRIFQVAKK